jgi:hypothetical protein
MNGPEPPVPSREGVQRRVNGLFHRLRARRHRLDAGRAARLVRNCAWRVQDRQATALRGRLAMQAKPAPRSRRPIERRTRSSPAKAGHADRDPLCLTPCCAMLLGAPLPTGRTGAALPRSCGHPPVPAPPLTTASSRSCKAFPPSRRRRPRRSRAGMAPDGRPLVRPATPFVGGLHDARQALPGAVHRCAGPLTMSGAVDDGRGPAVCARAR